MARKRTNLRPSRHVIGLAGTAPTDALVYHQQVLRERPSGLNQIFTRCRTVLKESSFLSVYFPLKLAFYNHGLNFVLGPRSKSKAEALAEWLAEEITTDREYTDPNSQETVKIELNQTREEAMRQFISDVWREFLLLDNCVAQWLDGAAIPTCLPPEKCRYEDVFGLPILYYTHGLSSDQIKRLPDEQQQRFLTKSEILLNPDEGEHFKVLKRGLVGGGFVQPGLFSIFRLLGEIDSKEIGFHGQGFNMRAATRHHVVGHEIKQGPHAGKDSHFLKEARKTAVLNVFNNRQGPHDLATNFDHEIKYPWPDMDRFDETAWKGTDRRLRNWGGPVARMMVGERGSENDLGTNLAVLRPQATDDRDTVQRFLAPVLMKAFGADENMDLRLAWSDMIFNDPKQAADLIKFSVQQGFASVETARRVIGMSPSEEDSRKMREADNPDFEKHYLPAFDMSHGITPQRGQLVDTSGGGEDAGGKGADPGKKKGRPLGAATRT